MKSLNRIIRLKKILTKIINNRAHIKIIDIISLDLIPIFLLMILIYCLAYLSLNMYNTYISIIVREKVENMAETLYKKVVKNGSSLAINIPAKEVKEQNLKVGDIVEVKIKKSDRPNSENLKEIDGLISDYWDMLEYLKDK